MEERLFYLPFSVFPGIGPKRFADLLAAFGSAQEAYESAGPRLAEVIGEKIAMQFDEFREQFLIEEYQERLQMSDVSFITLLDAVYPKRLKEIPKPPFGLYVKGKTEILPRQLAGQNDIPCIGVVGTRKVTSYGEEVTRTFTTELVDAGCTIVSGLALGIDAIAHGVTMTKKGRAIAVLGCGVDCCYPSSNESLYNRIIESGSVIISEYALGMPPSKGSFPSRNRIIAGLSDALLVTEGAEDSGSLITADYALEFGRHVFAIPGPITSSLSRGPLKLIRKGAKLVTSGEEILQELGVAQRAGRIAKKTIKGDTREEQVILDLLANESLHFDEIVKRTKRPSSDVGTALTLMEIKGLLTARDSIYSIRTA